ncbi:hypothetical protein NM208_g1381 [Fusarium decemcellulare]|uniref:Uncharacterized protein n=1 Tax=Fusarium decemcellulare TaxID=57161 RepID=A0ACC1SWG7_9HYPO|nr:hypothetical protein NM208_g1381 [Fusarium decemcellulare]
MARRYQPEGPCDVTTLGKPLRFSFCQRTAKNRFMKSAMAESLGFWSASEPGSIGIPTDGYGNLYRRWGENEWGVIVTGQIDIDTSLYHLGNVIIGREHHPTPGDLRFERFKQVASAATAHGSLLIGQLVHVGRQADARVSKETIAASAIQLEPRLGMAFSKPREATKTDITAAVESFAHAASYLEQAGFSGVQLHAAHGFLMSSFLSRSTNHRSDEYGGDLSNRMRLIVDVGRAIKAKVSSDFILGIKVNSVEFQEHGFTPSEARILCQTLESNHFDFVELTGGTAELVDFEGKAESTEAREGFFLQFAKTITPVLNKTRCYTSGGFRTGPGMVSAISTVDGIGLARAAAQEPSLPKDLLSGTVTGVIRPITPFVDNYHLSVALAGAQLGQIATNQHPLDSSDSERTQGVLRQLQTWTTTLVGDRPGFGWPKLEIESWD